MNEELYSKLHYLVGNENLHGSYYELLRIVNTYKLEVKLTLISRPYCSIKMRQIARSYRCINSTWLSKLIL